jgi:hypothetical protein
MASQGLLLPAKAREASLGMGSAAMHCAKALRIGVGSPLLSEGGGH